jgi:lipopolysaccharide/colanic/teichoic acid biosynthesis glycosyltransferase
MMTAQSSLLSGKRYPRKDNSTSVTVLSKRGQKVKQPKVKSRSLSFQGLYGEFFKRLFDIVFSLSVLILFSPIYMILALLIAISSKGPIFYVQERVGKNYRSFN